MTFAARGSALAFSLGALVGGGGVLACINLWSNSTASQETSTATFKYGLPQSPLTFHTYNAHSLAYDHSRKVPIWVTETITSDFIKSKVADRRRSTFKPDPAIPHCHSSSNDDYRNSGWSRGHMAAAGNYKYSQKSMDDTFYLTNIVPQDVDNNSGYWNRLEIFCRDLTKRFEQVYIISGPLFLPEFDRQSGKSYVKYEVLGKSSVAVPTHLFKVILAETQGRPPSLGAFIIPNKAIGNVNLTRFQVTMEELESRTGCTFYSNLDQDKVLDLCSEGSCQLTSLEKMALMSFTKKLNAAKTLPELERIWEELNRSTDIKADDKTKQVYNKRKLEL